MVSRGTKKPYLQAIGASATGVTQSCYIVRFKKYVIMLDCGLYQESDIATNYKKNQELLKKIKPRDIDWIILHECHADHTCLIPALYARGCQAHLIVPYGSKQFLKLLWEDSMKIFTKDCQKLNNKGIKATPFYIQDDIDAALNRIVEIGWTTIPTSPVSHYLTEDIRLQYYPSNHIINACQIYLTLQDGYTTHRLSFTGDVGGPTPQPYVDERMTLPYANLMLAESTYCQPKRMNKAYDRAKDKEKIEAVVRDSHRILIPCFSLGRTQTMLTILYQLWQEGKLPDDIKVVVDSPLAQKFCDIWPDDMLWNKVKSWGNLCFIKEWTESQVLQQSNEPCVVISASGFLVGGRVVEWLKYILPNRRNTICFVGYSGENNMASQIRYGDKVINVDGVEVENNANIVELVSFSSHASYEELMDYYMTCRYDKIALVHGEFEPKVSFANTLQNNLIAQGKSSRVIATNADSKIYF